MVTQIMKGTGYSLSTHTIRGTGNTTNSTQHKPTIESAWYKVNNTQTID